MFVHFSRINAFCEKENMKHEANYPVFQLESKQDINVHFDLEFWTQSIVNGDNNDELGRFGLILQKQKRLFRC